MKSALEPMRTWGSIFKTFPQEALGFKCLPGAGRCERNLTMECHVVEPILSAAELGARISLVVQIEWQDPTGMVLGETVHLKQKVWIQHEPLQMDTFRYTYMDVLVIKAGHIPTVQMDGMSFRFAHRAMTPESLMQVVETCTGLGALGKGAMDAGFSVKVQNEVRSEICDFLELQQGPVIVRGDIGNIETVATIMKHAPSAGILTAGVSCQPFSRMGDRRGEADARSNCLPKVLGAAYLMQTPIIVLECVAEVKKFPAFEECIKTFCSASGFHYEHILLELGDVWVSRRHRWWGVLTQGNFGAFKLFDWSGVKSNPRVSSVLNHFGTVPPDHAKQLQLTLYELRSIHELGTLQKYAIRLDQQAPTAVHAWGSHFYGCRCGCRTSGLALERFQRDGLHVLLIPTGGYTKHMRMELPHMRYPSAAECALLNGLSPNMQWGQDARLGLCLVGQLASPLQSAWVLTHVRQHLAQRGLVPPSTSGPLDVLSQQRTRLIEEAEQGGFFQFERAADILTSSIAVGPDPDSREVHTAPSQTRFLGHFRGVVNGVEYMIPIPFKAGCQIWHWIQAELAFYPVETKFCCTRENGDLATLNEPLSEATKLRLEISDGDGGGRTDLFERDDVTHAPPCISVPQDVKEIRSNGPPLDTKLSELEAGGAPWGDDEIAWHLAQLAKEADSFVAWVDPLVTASAIVHGTSLFLVDDGPFFRVEGWLLCVPFVSGHWLPLVGFVDDDHVHFSVWDTTNTHFPVIERLLGPLTRLVGATDYSITQYLTIATSPQSCGPDAIAHIHFALLRCMAPTPKALAHVSSLRHQAFVQQLRLDGTCQDAVLKGAGTQQIPVMEQIQNILIERGVGESEALHRASTAMDRIGLSKLQQALKSPFPWSQLKVLGNQCNPPMRWILAHELEEQIQLKAASGKEVGNRAKPKKQKTSVQKVKLPPKVSIRPDQIFVADNTFVGVNMDGSTESLKVISINTLGAEAMGVALCMPDQCRPYLSLQKPLSKKALGLIVVGEPRPELSAPRITEVRFPAKRLGGMEPLLVNAVLVQIGDRPVQKYKPDHCMNLDILQTCVMRFALYRDEHPDEWKVVTDRPIRHLQDSFPPLQMCLQESCGCGKWHSNVEQVASPLVDIWSRTFLTSTFRQTRPHDAELLRSSLS